MGIVERPSQIDRKAMLIVSKRFRSAEWCCDGQTCRHFFGISTRLIGPLSKHIRDTSGYGSDGRLCVNSSESVSIALVPASIFPASTPPSSDYSVQLKLVLAVVLTSRATSSVAGPLTPHRILVGVDAFYAMEHTRPEVLLHFGEG